MTLAPAPADFLESTLAFVSLALASLASLALVSFAFEAERLLVKAGFLSASFLSATFLAGYLGGEALVAPFLTEDTAAVVAGLTTVFEDASLGIDLDLERGTTEADLFTFASLASDLRAAFWSRLRI